MEGVGQTAERRGRVNELKAKLEDFKAVICKHDAFFKHTRFVDEYILAMVLVYFRRAGLSEIGFKKERYYFYALYLAAEMEEDTPDVLTEIRDYVVGRSPPGPAYVCGRLSETHARWTKACRDFLRGKTMFWKRMGGSLLVSVEECRQFIGVLRLLSVPLNKRDPAILVECTL